MERLALLLLTLACPLGAQQVFVVDDDPGPGVDFTDLEVAVKEAPSGSTLLVKEGEYLRADVNGKSLVITAEAGDVVTVTSGILVRNVPSQERVVIRGLRILGREPMVLFSNPGEVWVENCELLEDSQSHDPLVQAALHIAYCDSVVVRNTQGFGGVDTVGLGHPNIPGLVASFSSVYLYDCHFVGSEGSCSHIHLNTPGYGGFVYDSFVFASGTTFQGGVMDGLFCFTLPSGDGLYVDGPSGVSEVVLSNSQAEPGGGTNPPGEAIRIVSGSVEERIDTVRSFSVPTPIRSNENAMLSFEGVQGDHMFVRWNPTPQAQWLAHLGIPAPVHLSLASPSLYLGMLNADGTLTVSLAPALPPGFEATTVFVQGLAYNGGEPPFLFFLPPTAATVLDPAF